MCRHGSAWLDMPEQNQKEEQYGQGVNFLQVDAIPVTQKTLSMQSI